MRSLSCRLLAAVLCVLSWGAMAQPAPVTVSTNNVSYLPSSTLSFAPGSLSAVTRAAIAMITGISAPIQVASVNNTTGIVTLITQLPSQVNPGTSVTFQMPWSGNCAATTATSSLGCQPAAQSVSSSDLLLAWQPGSAPSTRAAEVSQYLSGGFPGIFSNLTVTGTSNLEGAVTAGSTLSVTGNETVTGATSLSTLSTSGLATLNGASVTGNETVGGTLGVTGATSLAGLSTSGLATLNSLSVTNGALMNGALTVYGETLLYADPNVWSGSTQSTTMQETIVATGSSTLSYADVNNWNLEDSINASGGTVNQFNLADNLDGIEGGRQTISQVLYQTAANVDPSGTSNFYVGAQFNSWAAFTQPGATHAAPLASFIAIAGNAEAGAPGSVSPQYIRTLHGEELSVGIMNSATVAGRAALFLGSGGSTSQGYFFDAALSIVGALAQNDAGNFRYGISFGGEQPWPIENTNGTMIGTYYGAPYSPSQQYLAKWGIDFEPATFPSTGNPYDGGFLRSKGFYVDGTGVMNIGTTYIYHAVSGLAIDSRGSLSTGATIQTAGSGYTASAVIYVTAYGGIWKVSTNASGVPVTISQDEEAVYTTTSPPSNPVTPSNMALNETGSGLTINIVWNTTATAISLNPSGGVVDIGSGGLVSNGSAGVTCSGSPTSSYATVGGVVTHC